MFDFFGQPNLLLFFSNNKEVEVVEVKSGNSQYKFNFAKDRKVPAPAIEYHLPT